MVHSSKHASYSAGFGVFATKLGTKKAQEVQPLVCLTLNNRSRNSLPLLAEARGHMEVELNSGAQH